jgi:hypothetical protein
MAPRAKSPAPAPRRDPELARQLGASRASGAPVSAVFRLKCDDGAPVPEPKATAAAARRVVARVKRRVGQAPERVNVFGNLGAFAVCGSPSFIAELLDQPEIQGAIANRRPGEDLLVRPVARRPARKAAPKGATARARKAPSAAR